MKKSKFRDAQIAFVLQQAEDGAPVVEVCRKAGIAEATFYNWRKKYVGLMPSEMKRLKQLEEANGKLKRLVADLSLDKAMLQDVVRRHLRRALRRRMRKNDPRQKLPDSPVKTNCFETLSVPTTNSHLNTTRLRRADSKSFIQAAVSKNSL